MKYEVSEELSKVLENYDYEIIILMKYSLMKYFGTGENPQFESNELRDLWFYCKTHELAYQIQRQGYRWFGSFPHVELQSYLAKNAAKILNPNYVLEKRRGNC